MILGCVALGTEGYQIGGSIRAVGRVLPEPQVMNLQDRVICFVLAVGILTVVSISVQDIFPQVIKAVLLSILVLFPRDGGIVDFLDVKGGYLAGNAFDWNNPTDTLDESVVSVELMTNARCQPLFFPPTIGEATLTVSQPIAASATILSAFGQSFGHPFEHFKFATNNFLFIVNGAKSNILVPCVNTQIRRLSVSTRTVDELDGERVTLEYFGFAALE